MGKEDLGLIGFGEFAHDGSLDDGLHVYSGYVFVLLLVPQLLQVVMLLTASQLDLLHLGLSLLQLVKRRELERAFLRLAVCVVLGKVLKQHVVLLELGRRLDGETLVQRCRGPHDACSYPFLAELLGHLDLVENIGGVVYSGDCGWVLDGGVNVLSRVDNSDPVTENLV